jgi:hypothetical protein
MAREIPLLTKGQTRVFIQEDGAGVTHVPKYLGLAKAGSISWPQGDRTPQRVPSDDAYSEWDEVGEIIGVRGLPTMSLDIEMQRVLSEMLRLVRKRCPIDIQIHAGACKNPSDFDRGYEMVLVLEKGRATDYGISDLGDFDGSAQGGVNETIPFTGRDLYQVVDITAGAIATQADQEIIAVVICDTRTCAACGLTASDGCQRIFAVTKADSGTAKPVVIFSTDGGGSTDTSEVTPFANTEDPSDVGCSGIYLVVLGSTTESLMYAEIADIIAGTETWAEVATGFVGGSGPVKMFSQSQAFNWFAGLGGYIYFSSDITAGVEVQNAGVATTENLKAIHGIDNLNVVAVGENNAVVVTTNGGASWAALTGPDAGIDLNTVCMKSVSEWLVGGDNGKLYYTIDAGVSWAEKAFNGSGTGKVTDIKFSTGAVGYLAHQTSATKGRILRTINGGNSWVVQTVNPANDIINGLAACTDDPNVVFAGGLTDDAADGILYKGA